MRARPILLAVLGLLSLVPAPGLGRNDQGPPAPEPPAAPEPAAPLPPGEARDGDWVELEGRIRLLGNEPFPDLVLTGPDGQDWYLEDSRRGLFRSYEQRTVRVRGRVELTELTLANGRSLGFRRRLLDAELLEP